MSLVATEDRGAVRHIVLNRPEKRNAMNGELVLALGAALQDAAADDVGPRASWCAATGPMFSSGMDLGDLQDPAGDAPDKLRRFRAADPQMLEPARGDAQADDRARSTARASAGRSSWRSPRDMRVMAEDAFAGIMEVRVGLLPDVGGCSRLPAVVGPGQREGADHDRQGDRRPRGAPDRLRQPDRAPPRSSTRSPRRFANELLACAPQAVGLAKRVIDAAAKPALAATLEQEVAGAAAAAPPAEDFAEGARAFLEKRDPEFAGH